MGGKKKNPAAKGVIMWSFYLMSRVSIWDDEKAQMDDGDGCQCT